VYNDASLHGWIAKSIVCTIQYLRPAWRAIPQAPRYYSALRDHQCLAL